MFITCSFKSDGSGRAYTYASDIEEDIATGDRVVVLGPDGIEKIVTVIDVDVPQPPFECKQIIRLHVPDEDAQKEEV